MKKDNTGEIERLRKDIITEIQHWKDINENGCSDPFWPDGYNMNLTRNHIIYAKYQISEICLNENRPLPEEYYLPTPPKVPDKYMANLKNERRVQMIGAGITTGKNRYDELQMSLF